jgi:hypothetical protein
MAADACSRNVAKEVTDSRPSTELVEGHSPPFQLVEGDGGCWGEDGEGRVYMAAVGSDADWVRMGAGGGVGFLSGVRGEGTEGTADAGVVERLTK